MNHKKQPILLERVKYELLQEKKRYLLFLLIVLPFILIIVVPLICVILNENTKNQFYTTYQIISGYVVCVMFAAFPLILIALIIRALYSIYALKTDRIEIRTDQLIDKYEKVRHSRTGRTILLYYFELRSFGKIDVSKEEYETAEIGESFYLILIKRRHDTEVEEVEIEIDAPPHHHVRNSDFRKRRIYLLPRQICFRVYAVDKYEIIREEKKKEIPREVDF